MTTTYHRNKVLDIFREALQSVDPYELVVSNSGKVRDKYRHAGAGRLLVIGFGKAAVSMGKAAEDTLGDLISDGILITKQGHSKGHSQLGKLRVIEAGHPIPDEQGYYGTAEAIRLLQEADERTLVLCLISGGGSALLVCPHDGITLREKQYVSELLLKSGADIAELNTVRKHISKVKGGRLAEIAGPAEVISLILSDVIGDRLDVIASGPTAPDKTTYAGALKVLDKYSISEKVPESILRLLDKGISGRLPETPKSDNPVFAGVENIIIGSNSALLSRAAQRAEEMGYYAEILSSGVQGDARDAGKVLARKAIAARNANGPARPFCLISGGETTVSVKGGGLGGRNMELALAFAMEIEGIDGITLLSAGTDGTDGPTDAAGAIVNGATVHAARTAGLDPAEYLNNNDSYNFFRKTDGLLITGPTGTNVMDIQIILIGQAETGRQR